MAMTLNEARVQMAQACTIGGSVPARFVAGWLEAVNAHLTQPAQAVDVVYSEGVCGDGAAILRNGEPMRVHEIVAALNATRALAGEQAGWRVPDAPVAQVSNEMIGGRKLTWYSTKAMHETPDWTLLYALPASPTPDKETQR